MPQKLRNIVLLCIYVSRNRHKAKRAKETNITLPDLPRQYTAAAVANRSRSRLTHDLMQPVAEPERMQPLRVLETGQTNYWPASSGPATAL